MSTEQQWVYNMAHQMLMAILNSSGASEWVYIETATSDPGTTVSKTDSSVSDVDTAKDSLESSFPASNQDIGDTGCVYDGDSSFYVFEAQ